MVLALLSDITWILLRANELFTHFSNKWNIFLYKTALSSSFYPVLLSMPYFAVNITIKKDIREVPLSYNKLGVIDNPGVVLLAYNPQVPLLTALYTFMHAFPTYVLHPAV